MISTWFHDQDPSPFNLWNLDCWRLFNGSTGRQDFGGWRVKQGAESPLCRSRQDNCHHHTERPPRVRGKTRLSDTPEPVGLCLRQSLVQKTRCTDCGLLHPNLPFGLYSHTPPTLSRDVDGRRCPYRATNPVQYLGRGRLPNSPCLLPRPLAHLDRRRLPICKDILLPAPQARFPRRGQRPNF